MFSDSTHNFVCHKQFHLPFIYKKKHPGFANFYWTANKIAKQLDLAWELLRGLSTSPWFHNASPVLNLL